MTLPISEVFGPTIQGEGPRAGRVCWFIRFGGCNLSCSWCADPATPVLMADWSEKPIRDVVVGDLVMSYRNRRYEAARVEKVMSRHASERVTVVTDDGEVVCTPDHVFANPHHIDGRRRSRAEELLGRHVRMVRSKGWAPDEEVRTHDWWTGWAQGLILGDGHVGTGRYPKVWLRVCDKELADTYCKLLATRGESLTNNRPNLVREQNRKTARGRVVYSVAHNLSRLPWVAGLPEDPDEIAGFLAGFFDAEGSVGRNQITLNQKDDKTLDRVAGMIRSLEIPCSIQYGRRVTINGAVNVDAFMRLTRPVLDRKSRKRQQVTSRMLASVAVREVKEAQPGDVVNLTTSTGYFFAGGMLVEQCDTPYTWDNKRFNMRKEMTLLTPYAIAAMIPATAPEVILTGGEPLIHQCKESWARLLQELVHRRIAIALETNGTISPNPVTARSVHHFSISPKLPNAGSHRGHQGAQMAPWPAELRQRAVLKFVVEGRDDVELAVTRADAMGWPRDRVWMMPEGTDPDILLKRWPEVVEAAVAKRVNATQRLHVLAWGNERGR